MADQPRRWRDPVGLADHLDTTPDHVRRLARDGLIPVHRLGRLLRFDLDEVEAALDQQLRKAS